MRELFWKVTIIIMLAISSDVIFPAFSNLSVNGKLSVNCHNLSVNYQEFLKRAVDHVN